MYKILVADDEPNIAKMLEVFLIKAGFEVIKASGGIEALEIIKSDVKVDLIIIDMKMPKVSGMDILREMGRLGRKAPVVILTGMMDAQRYSDELKSMGYALEDVVYKPVELSTLLKNIKRKLGIEDKIAN